MSSPLPLVLVEWYDAEYNTGWHSLKDIKDCKFSICQTVGWLVEDDNNEGVRLVMTVSGDDYIGNIDIPAGCIRSIEHLSPNPNITAPSATWVVATLDNE